MYIVFLAIIISLLFIHTRELTKKIKELEAEKTSLINNNIAILNDIQKRNEEIRIKNEELKGYLDILEKEQEECLAKKVNANIRRMLKDAGI